MCLGCRTFPRRRRIFSFTPTLVVKLALYIFKILKLNVQYQNYSTFLKFTTVIEVKLERVGLF